MLVESGKTQFDFSIYRGLAIIVEKFIGCIRSKAGYFGERSEPISLSK